MKLTKEYIHSQLTPYCASATHIMVGYSGGVDSHVLLHLLSNVPEIKQKLTAVYVNHGLQQCANDWADFCQNATQAFAVNFRVLRVNAQAAPGQSPEEAARNARYQAFKDILGEKDILLFAHHRNDQLETVLLQLFRGAGLKGLSGMPVVIDFSKGVLIRPLLDVNQQDIIQYAQQHNLQWIEDPSNQNHQYDRNYLRQKIIPLLENRWPGIDTTVSRVAGHCAQAQAALSAGAKEKMRLLYDPQRQCLSIQGLLQYDDTTQQWIIREWMSFMGVRMPTQKVMSAILQDLVPARQGANPLVQHDGYGIQRYRDNLYLVAKNKKPDLCQDISWEKHKDALILPENGSLQLKDAEQGIAKYVWQQGNIQVKYRQGGEKIALANRNVRHSLKKLYQEAGIAPWQRDVIPLIYIDGKLAAIAGYWISADFFTQGEDCISLNWVRSIF